MSVKRLQTTTLFWSSKQAKVLVEMSDYNSAVQVLLQGIEFYPESAELKFQLTGVYLNLKDKENANNSFIGALQLDADKIGIFEEQFPEYANLPWIKDAFKIHKKAST